MATLNAPDLTIAEAAELAGISAHTIRYYERAGLLAPIERTDSGHRRLSPRRPAPTTWYSPPRTSSGSS